MTWSKSTEIRDELGTSGEGQRSQKKPRVLQWVVGNNSQRRWGEGGRGERRLPRLDR